jgi:hypothetical protein
MAWFIGSLKDGCDVSTPTRTGDKKTHVALNNDNRKIEAKEPFGKKQHNNVDG